MRRCCSPFDKTNKSCVQPPLPFQSPLQSPPSNDFPFPEIRVPSAILGVNIIRSAYSFYRNKASIPLSISQGPSFKGRSYVHHVSSTPFGHTSVHSRMIVELRQLNVSHHNIGFSSFLPRIPSKYPL